MELAVAGGAEFYLWAEFPAPGSWHQVVGCVAQRFSFAERADKQRFHALGRHQLG